VSWSLDGQRLATACTDQTIHIWNASTGEPLQQLQGHASVVRQAAFLGGDDLLASRAWDGTLRLWEPRTGQQVLNFPGGGWHFQFDPGTGRLGLFEPEGLRFELHQLVRAEVTRNFWEARKAELNGPWCVEFSPDGQTLASACDDGIRLWDVASGRELAHVPGSLTQSVMFDVSDGSVIASSWGTLLQWPITRPAPDKVAVGIPRTLAPPGRYRGAGLDGRGNLLAYIHDDHVHVLQSGTNFLRLVAGSGVHGVAISPDGKWIATRYAKRGGVSLWKAESKALPREIPTSSASHVRFTPDSRWLVTGSGNEYRFWDVASGQPGLRVARPGRGNLAGAIAFTHDGRMMAIARTQWMVQLIDPRNGEELASLEHPEPQMISWLAFNSAGTQLAVATEGHVIQVWDLAKLRADLAALKLDWH
jgi:WD40 repeat protein